MSEYQYYEFLAVDTPLDDRAMADLRGISTRADITPTSFRNAYNYSDLKADAAKLLQQYFDVHVYIANWGTRRLVLRLPGEVAPLEEFEPYFQGEGADVRFAGEHIIIELWSETEDYEGWTEGEGWMGSLAGVRAELLRGDLRLLYLIWLHSVGVDYFDDEEGAEVQEPPVPAGLAQLPPSLTSLVEFLRMDPDLVAAAAEASRPAQAEQRDIAPWIAALDDDEKNTLLLRVVRGEHARVTASLVRRFRAESRRDGGGPAPRLRTVAQLSARAEEIEGERRRRQALVAVEAERRRRAAAAKAKRKRLDALAKRIPAAWQDVGELVDSKKPKAYDKAVGLLVDLHDLAVRQEREDGFFQRLEALRREHSRKPSFLLRLVKANLT